MATPIPLAPESHSLQDVKLVQPSPSESPRPDLKDLDGGETLGTSLTIIDQPPLQTLDIQTLDNLASLDRLSVTRRLKVKGVLFLKGKKNTFLVKTPDETLVFNIEEENSWWVGYFCYGLRPLQLLVRNGAGEDIIRISRPYAFTTRILPCQLQRLQVFSPPDTLIGSVLQQWTAVKPLYLVKDLNGRNVFEVHGPRITVSCFQDVQFQILRPDGSLVACTNKRWEGIVHALFLAPITDTFTIVFLEKSLTGSERALLLAAALLLDYMYYDV